MSSQSPLRAPSPSRACRRRPPLGRRRAACASRTPPRLPQRCRGAAYRPTLALVDAYVVDAVRSPIGKRDGALSTIRGDELAAQVLNALVARSGVDPAEVEDVQMGCVTQVGEQGWNIGRMAPLVAGWPESVCG